LIAGTTMPRFEFRLKAVLLVREAARVQARSELAAVIAREAKLQSQLAKLEKQLRGATQGSAVGHVDVARLQATASYASTVRQAIREVREQLKHLDHEIDNARQRVVEADRDVRILEDLRERHHQQFREEQAAIESKRLDEVGLRSARRAAS
jgi:flagellar protein FliJ